MWESRAVNGFTTDENNIYSNGSNPVSLETGCNLHHSFKYEGDRVKVR